MQAAPFQAKPIESVDDRVERARQSRRGMRGANCSGGHCIGYTRDPSSGQVHVVGSIVAQLAQGESLTAGVRDDNVRYRKIAGRGRRNLLFIVDTSGSMLTADRLAMVKGCVVSLLEDAYVKRTRVALVGFGGARARLVLPFTSSPEMAARRIEGMKGGGGTPLAEALGIASGLIERLDGEPAEIILLSDGRYNRSRRGPASKTLSSFSAFCQRRHVTIHLVDSSSGGKTSRRRAEMLAALLRAKYHRLDDLRAETLSEIVATEG